MARARTTWFVGVPILGLVVVGYTLFDFVGSVSIPRGSSSALGADDAETDAPPVQSAEVVETPAVSVAPPRAVPTLAAPRVSAVVRSATEDVAVDRSIHAVIVGEQPDHGNGKSIPTTRADIASAVAHIQTRTGDPMPEVRKLGAYSLLELAGVTGDPDGSMRVMLQGMVSDPDPEIADFARHALLQLPSGQAE